jgi:hypothetical protein
MLDATGPRDLSEAAEHYTIAMAREAAKVDFQRHAARLRHADPLPSPNELSALLGAITHLVKRVAEGRPDLSGLGVLQESVDFSFDLCSAVHPKPGADDGLIVWQPITEDDEYGDFDNNDCGPVPPTEGDFEHAAEQAVDNYERELDARASQ